MTAEHTARQDHDKHIAREHSVAVLDDCEGNLTIACCSHPEAIAIYFPM